MNEFLCDPSPDLLHPLKGWIKAVTSGADHAGFNATLLPIEVSDTLLLIWRSGLAHNAWPGSELKLLISRDEGSSFDGLRSIYLSKEWDTRNFAGGVLGGKRVGLIASRFRGVGASIEMALPVFIYSDDGGANWSVSEVPLPETTPCVSFHGDIIRWPAAAGGDDETGYVAFSYNFPRKTLDAIYTRDNGATWFWRTDIIVSDGVIADCITEAWVAAVEPNGPWLMTARPTASAQQRNVVVLTSTNLIDWDGPRDGGVLLSSNAPALIIEGETAYLYTVSRRGYSRELPNAAQEQLGNRMLMASAQARALIAGDADFSTGGGWREVATLPDSAVGYMFPRKIRRCWFAAFNCGETGTAGTSECKRSWLALITPHPPVLVDAPTLRAATPLDNQIDNGDFSVWSRGDRFQSARSGQITADRWRVRHPATDLVDVEKVIAQHPLSGASTWLQKCCNSPSGAGPHHTIQSIADVGLGAAHWLTLMFRAWSVTGTKLSSIRLRQYFGRGGSPPVEIKLANNVALTNEPLLFSFKNGMPAHDGKKLGPDAALQIIFEERAEGDQAAYDVVYGDVALILSPAAGIVRPRSEDAERAACQRYFADLEIWSVVSGTGAAGVAHFSATFPAMARTPTLKLRALDVGVDPDESGTASAAQSPSVVVLRLSRTAVDLLARPLTPGSLCRISFELDAEWAEEFAEGAPFADSGGLARFDSGAGVFWVPKEALSTEQYARFCGALCNADSCSTSNDPMASPP